MTTLLRNIIFASFSALAISCVSKEKERPVLWEHITSENYIETMVNCIAVDSKNNKWFTTYGGLLKYDNSQWAVYNKFTGSPCDTLFDMAIDSKDSVYCITSHSTIVRYDGNRWSTISDGKVYNPHAICTDNNDNVWVAGLSGLYRFDGTSWTRYYGPPFSNSNHWAMDMAVDGNNHLWIITEEKGLVKFDGSKWTILAAAEGLPDWNYNCLGIDNTGNIWIGGNGSGAWKYNGTGFVQFKKDTYPSASNATNFIDFDTRGNGWFGTDNGVLKYNGKNWDSFFDKPNEINFAVDALAVDKNNDVWVASMLGVYKILTDK